MRATPGLQKTLIVWVAAYVLALNAIVGSFAAAFAVAAADPAIASICHSSDDKTQPGGPQRATDCSHCVLCQAPGSGAVLPVIAAILEPAATGTRFIARPLDAATTPLSPSVRARAPPLLA
jgi:hypothetical protein